MIYTFYSYKGGVGRTMALANIAEIYHQWGLKVLMVDWDLEAPGLDRYFTNEIDSGQLDKQPGVLDLILDYQDQMTKKLDLTTDESEWPFAKPRDYVVDVAPKGERGSKPLWLLTAGRRDKEHFSTYGAKVLSFDWEDFYQNWAGEQYFEWLRRRFEDLADVVLIDSRTGVTEISGICTYQLADVVVMLFTTNEQNLIGTRKMAQRFTSQKVKSVRPPDRPLKVVVLPARIELGESDRIEMFRERSIGELDRLPLAYPLEELWKDRIPYIPRYAYEEEIAARTPDAVYATDLVKAYENIARKLAVLAPPDHPLGQLAPPHRLQIILSRSSPPHPSKIISGPSPESRWHPFERSIALIYRENRVVVGMGFLMGERYVVTCAHVVWIASGGKDYADLRGLTVSLDFPYVDDAPDSPQATVVALSHPSLGEGQYDIAILTLDQAVAEDISAPVIQAREKDVMGHDLKALGVPDISSGAPVWAEVTMVMSTLDGLWQLKGKETGLRLTQGYSGAPLWDEELQGIVGIIRSSIEGEEGEEEDREAKEIIRTAFAIPVTKIADLFQRELPNVSLQWLPPEALPPSPIFRRPPPRLLISVPNVEGAVARAEAEIARARLKADNRLLIVGAPGVGKTVLGAQVAQALYPEEDIFWYDFTLDTADFQSVSWKLADFLAQRGDAAILNLLQTRSQAEEAIDAARLQTALVNAFSGQDYLLCFDNAHHVLHAPEQERDAIFGLFRALATQVRPSRLLLVSRERFPDDLPIPDLTLRGMGQDDFRKLILHYLPEFPADEPVGDGSGRTLAQLVWERLDGNPQYLRFFADLVVHIRPLEVTKILKVLRAIPEQAVGSYLHHQVYENLSDGERNVLTTVALFRRPPEVSLLVEVLRRGHLVEEPQLVIRALADTRFLYDIVGGRVLVNDLLKDYLVSLLGVRGAKERHRHHLIAEAYAEQEGVISRGEEAYHRLQAGEPVSAYRLIEEHFQDLLAAGQAGAMLAVMEGLKVTHFEDSPEMWPRVLLLRGNLLRHLGRYEAAVETHLSAYKLARGLAGPLPPEILLEIGRDYLVWRRYDSARDTLEDLLREQGPALTLRLRGALYCTLGEVHLRLRDMPQAQKYLQESLSPLDQADDRQTLVKAYALLVEVYTLLGKQDEAERLLERIERRVRGEQWPDSLEVALLYSRGGMYYLRRGAIEKAVEYTKRAVSIAERIGEVDRLVGDLSNLGQVMYSAGRWKEAEEHLSRAAEMAYRTGNAYWVWITYNLMFLLQAEGRWEEAETYWERIRRGAKSADEHVLWRLWYANLLRERGLWERAQGDEMEARRQWSKSYRYLEKIEDIERAPEKYGEGQADPDNVLERKIMMVEVAGLLREHWDTAQALSEEILGDEEAQEYFGGEIWQSVAVFRTGREEWEQAEEAYEQAEMHFEEAGNEYELGRTYYHWGWRYQAEGRTEEARAMWERSLALFRSLTAEGHENQYVRLVEATMGKRSERPISGLSRDTYNACLRVFKRCAEFEKDSTLRSRFVTESLKPFQRYVPQADGINERIMRFIGTFADIQTASGKWVLIEFVDALLPRYEGTGTYLDLLKLKRMLERDFGVAYAARDDERAR